MYKAFLKCIYEYISVAILEIHTSIFSFQYNIVHSTIIGQFNEVILRFKIDIKINKF